MKKLRQLELLRQNNQELTEELENLKTQYELDNMLRNDNYETAKELIIELESIKERWSELISEVENIQFEYEELIQELKDMRQEMKQASKEFRKQMK